MMRFPMRRARQTGSILLVAIVFIVFFTLIAISIFKGSLTSVQSIGNMQWRAESIWCANDAIDRLLSTATCFQNPASCVANTYSCDANGDKVNDISVTLPAVQISPADTAKAGPRCIRLEPIPTTSLDPGNPEDVNCMGSSAGAGGLVQEQGTSVEFVSPGVSLCSNSEWSTTVRATDRSTNATVDIVQGVGVRILTTSVADCN